MAARLAGSQQIDRGVGAVLGPLGAGDDERPAAGTRADNLQQMQGIDDHARVEHVLNADLLVAEQSRRVAAGVFALIDRNLGQLFGRRAELVHMALGNQGIARIGRDQAVGRVELGVQAWKRRGFAHAHRLARPRIAQDAQHVVTHASVNGCGRPPEHAGGRRSAQLDQIEIAGVELQVFRNDRRPQHAVIANRHTRQQAIDVLLFQTRVGNRLPRHFSDNPQRGFSSAALLGGHFGKASNGRFSFQTHAYPPMTPAL